MDLENIIIDTFNQPHHAMAYYVSRRLRSLFPDKGIVESAAHYFDLHGFAADGLCTLSPREVPHPHITTSSAPVTGAQTDVPRNALIDVTWEGETLSVLLFSLPSIGDSQQHYYAIIAETSDLAHAFHAAVCAWSTRLNEDVILVFDVNGWSRDEVLYAAIKNATLDNLVLEGTLKEDILSDITGFFSAREMYAEYDVPWKRGILFVGPAGNGKTHAVKALINRLDQTCLYVKTFGGGGPGDQWGIRAIFAEARRLAPCILVLEDLDSLITRENRSYFLNELDGFAGNSGLLTLATTNHPDRLDPAIVDRPSRFDRKYPFKPPAYAERETYVGNWNEHLKAPLRLSREGIESVAAQTEDFSFAYLKELFLSAMMRWIAEPKPGTMDGIMASQAPILRDQMASVIDLPSDPGYGGEESMPHVMSGPARRGGPRRQGPARGPHVPR